MATAEVQLQISLHVAELGLWVIRKDVRYTGSLQSVVNIEDRAVLVVGLRFEETVGITRLHVESIVAARAVLRILKAIHERHVEVVASVVSGLVDLVFQLSDIFATAGRRLGELDRNSAIGSQAVPSLLIDVTGLEHLHIRRTAAKFLIDGP